MNALGKLEADINRLGLESSPKVFLVCVEGIFRFVLDVFGSLVECILTLS